jgi:YVTN family beta-propeller protein
MTTNNRNALGHVNYAMVSNSRQFLKTIRAWLCVMLMVLIATANAWASSVAYVSNTGDNSISVVDTGSGTAATSIPVPQGPFGIAASPDGRWLYVTHPFSGSGITIIDRQLNSVAGNISAVGLSGPTGIAVHPSAPRMYVTNIFAASLAIIDTTNNSIIATTGVGDSPSEVAVSPDGQRVYVTNQSSNTVSVLSTATNQIVDTISSFSGPIGIAVNPQGTRAYVANAAGDTVSVIDLGTNTVLNVISDIGMQSPRRIAISPSGDRVYVSNANTTTVSVISASSNSVISIPVGATQEGLAVSPDGLRVYVTLNGNSVAVINAGTNNVVGSPITVGLAPSLILIPPAPTNLSTATAPIPTLSEWAMIFMASLLAIFGIRKIRPR